MTTLIDYLRALLGGNALAAEIALLTAADARASRLPREHGVLYSDAIHAAIDELTRPGPCSRDAARAAYYLGLQVGMASGPAAAIEGIRSNLGRCVQAAR